MITPPTMAPAMLSRPAQNDHGEDLQPDGAQFVDIDTIENPQHDTAHGGHQGGDGPGKGKDPLDVNPQREGRRLVVGHRAHVDALGGSI